MSRQGRPTLDARDDEARLFDAHCHLDWFAHPTRVAREADAAGLDVLAVTVTPEGWRTAAGELAGCPNVALAAGLHPWWAANGHCGEHDVDELCRAVEDQRLVGEVGLDRSRGRDAPDAWSAQAAAFERVCAAAAGASAAGAPRVLSIHSACAATDVLDVLERTGAAGCCRCVLHWFSGSTPELWRAVRAGCWFSFGERSLATGRGREYARLVPAARLLTETDLPAAAGDKGGAATLVDSVGRTLDGLARARGADVRALVAQNARALLGD